MATDTFSLETYQRFHQTPLWKPWMRDRRLFQAESLTDVEQFIQLNYMSARIALDFETEDLSRTPESVCGICLAYGSKEGIYIPIRHKNHPDMNINPEEVWKMVLNAISKKLLIVYNWEFEGTILGRMGVERNVGLSSLNDAMIYRWLYDSDRKQFNLKDACQELLGHEMLHIYEVPGVKLGKKKKEINFSLSNPEEASLYAAADPIFSIEILDLCKAKVDQEQHFIATLEHQLLGTLAHMRNNRVTVDRAFLQQARIDLTRWIDYVYRQMVEKAGEEFDPKSTKDVSRVLKNLGVPLKRTKNEKQENFETNAKALEPLVKQYPIIDDLLFHRSLSLERSMYVDALLNNTTEENPTALFRFASTGAPTGRFSSGGVDEGDSLYTPFNAQSVVSSSAYRKAAVRRVVIQGLQLRS